MKKLKFLFLPFAFLLFALVAFASKAHAQVDTHYEYLEEFDTEGATDFSDLGVANNWSNATGSAPTCLGSKFLCAIRIISSTGGTPNKANLMAAIANYLNTFGFQLSFSVTVDGVEYTISISRKPTA